jgi:hypothetical protein
MMPNPRTVRPSTVRFKDIRRLFSNFDHVETVYLAVESIRRLFSLSRAFRGRTLVVEEIPPVGIIADENRQIQKRFRDHKIVALQRLSFWRTAFNSQKQLATQRSKNLIGYAILKHDIVPTHSIEQRRNQWHVFEAVFIKYPHHHNYIHCARTFEVRIGFDRSNRYAISGVLYCQQNGLNKACAQVALRSLLEPYMPERRQLSFSQIHRLAKGSGKDFDPSCGLSSRRIERVIRGLGFRKNEYTSLDYEHSPEGLRKTHQYQNYLYAGVESGMGALLGFKFTGPRAGKEQHIIPVFGHTFITGEFALPQFDKNNKIWRPGWVGNVFVGAVAAVVVGGMYGPLAQFVINGSQQTVPQLTVAQLLGAVIVGIGGGNILTQLAQRQADRLAKDTLASALAAMTKPAATPTSVAPAAPGAPAQPSMSPPA